MEKITIVIPCYNEEAALPYFLREIRKVADQMSATKPLSFEFLFVNDGSKDQTLDILREAGAIHIFFQKFWKRSGNVCGVSKLYR